MTLREQQQLAERHAYELRVPDKPLQRNPLNGRFLKGHTHQRTKARNGASS